MNPDQQPHRQSIAKAAQQLSFANTEIQLAGIPDIGAELVRAYKGSPDASVNLVSGTTHPEPFLRTFFYRSDENYSEAVLIAAAQNFTKANFNLFKNQIVIDVGAGKHGIGYLAAVAADAKAYIAIEQRHHAACLEQITLLSQCNHKIPFAVVDRNARNFLELIPDESVSFLVSGIDAFLYIQDVEGLRDLGLKMQPKLHPQGAIISINSDVPFEGLAVTKVEKMIADVKIARKVT